MTEFKPGELIQFKSYDNDNNDWQDGFYVGKSNFNGKDAPYVIERNSNEYPQSVAIVRKYQKPDFVEFEGKKYNKIKFQKLLKTLSPEDL